MAETTTGLVIRTRPLTETSLIVQWLTPSFGRLATVAKGARRPKSAFQGKLDLFYLADFSFSRSRVSELHNLREVSVLETHEFLRREIGYLRQASYCVKLIEQATETEASLGSLYEVLRAFLQHLPGHVPQAQSIFGFELKLLGELGLDPDLDQSRLTAGTKALANRLKESDWPAISRLKFHQAQENELDRYLDRFLLYHLGRVPKGRHAALTGRE